MQASPAWMSHHLRAGLSLCNIWHVWWVVSQISGVLRDTDIGLQTCLIILALRLSLCPNIWAQLHLFSVVDGGENGWGHLEMTMETGKSRWRWWQWWWWWWYTDLAYVRVCEWLCECVWCWCIVVVLCVWMCVCVCLCWCCVGMLLFRQYVRNMCGRDASVRVRIDEKEKETHTKNEWEIREKKCTWSQWFFSFFQKHKNAIQNIVVFWRVSKHKFTLLFRSFSIPCPCLQIRHRVPHKERAGSPRYSTPA